MYDLLILDMEGVIIDEEGKLIPDCINMIYRCRNIGMNVCVATGATKALETKEIELVRESINVNVYSSVDLGYGEKSNPDFFTYILEDMGSISSNAILLDDGCKGIDGASLIGIATFYLSKDGYMGADFNGDYSSFLDVIYKNDKN